MSAIKEIIKSILPSPMLKFIQNYGVKKAEAQHKHPSTHQIFTRIYADGTWGESSDPTQKFFSGSGSHDPVIVETYIKAIQKFLSSFENEPDVVDLGCGDFFVGSRVRPLCDTYVACDIVESLINFNKEKYKNQNVDFRVLDITKDKLPEGDIVFVRQVFQHLSNKQINRALPKIVLKYKYRVLTEHLPATDSFIHNLDKPPGPDTRLGLNSGVVLTSAPFNLEVKETSCLCEAAEQGGIIKTYLYRLA